MDKVQYHKIRQQLRFDPQPLYLFIHVLLDCGLLTIVLWSFVERHFLIYLAGQVAFAFFVFRSFGLMHDAVHGNLAKSKAINTLFGIFYGSTCFLPFLNWRAIHLQHHYWAGNVEQDPVMRLILDYPKMNKSKQRFLNFFWKSWIPIMAVMQHVVFWSASASIIRQGKKPLDRLAYLLALIPPTLFIGLTAWSIFSGPYLGLLPAVVLYMIMVEVINFPHHLELNHIYGSTRLNVLEQDKISRSCVYSNFFSKYILLNFNLHSEHHLYPNLPWYELSKAYSLLSEQSGKDHNVVFGHKWIIQARRKDLGEVLRSQKPASENQIAAA